LKSWRFDRYATIRKPDPRLRSTLIILVALSIRDAEISPFDDISTPRGSSQIPLGHCRVTEIHPVSSSYGRMPPAGTDVAISVVIMQRREVENMKIATSFLAAVLFTGALGSINTAMSADGVISKDELATGSYCNEKFHAMTGASLIPMTRSSITPGLSSTSTGRATRVPLGKIKSKIKSWKPSIVLRPITRIDCW